MDTLEATTTVLNLWPTSFRGGNWREILADEFQSWDGLERRATIDKLKATHNGRRISLDILRAARRSAAPGKTPSGGMADRQRVALDWLTGEGLADAYRRAPVSDQLDIDRFIFVLVNYPDWQAIAFRHAGSPRYWQPWERIENLADAARKTKVGNRVVVAPIKDQLWSAPMGTPPLILPEPPVQMATPGGSSGKAWLDRIAERNGGWKNGGAIMEDPEYQDYLADYAKREADARRRQHPNADMSGDLVSREEARTA